MNIINLTPHDINVVTPSGVITIHRSNNVARCNSSSVQIDTVNDIPIFQTIFGEIVNLPPPQGDTLFIVSMIVKDRAINRTDLVSPSDLVRDSNGVIIGCKGLSK